MPDPDVSVIIPVYNTMPYLTKTLSSLATQTLGLARIQVVAVDDGSTDGSGEELDRFAKAHPDSVVVIHQANSGGPATPCNRGLDVATGRYVFFLGADDYLGDEALQRLVEKADAWGSDVIFGRMVGAGGRVVNQRIFKETDPDLDLVESDLAFALSNTKLFRRELVERHGLRYSRDLRVGSDQPFTIEAIVHAERVSVLVDYTYYYAVRRDDSTNISFSSHWRQRVDDIGDVVQHVAGLLPAGAERDAILRRHFGWELTKLFRADFPEVDESEQAAMVEAVGALADRYLTDRISERLSAHARLTLRLVQARDFPLLHELLDDQESQPKPLLCLDGERVYSTLPGFRDDRSMPDTWYDVTDQEVRGRVVDRLASRRVRLEGARLKVVGEVGFTADSARHLRLSLDELPQGERVPPARRFERGSAPPGIDCAVTLTEQPPGTLTRFHADLDLAGVLQSSAAAGTKWSVRLRADVGRWTYDLPVPARGPRRVAEVRSRLRRFRLIVRRGRRGQLLVGRRQVPLIAPRAPKRSGAMASQKM